MKQDLSNKRKIYNQNSIDFNTLEDNPLDQFNVWYHQADQSKAIDEANAMTLSTLGLDGFPRSRVVLLKEFNSEGFVFFTNYTSEKGKSIEANPHVCLSFFWPSLQQQVIIKGITEKVSEQNSDEYFATRPRDSQIGAWVSPQSEEIEEHHDFEKAIAFYQQKFDGVAIPRPPHWGGFLVRPVRIEFWQGRPSRLHDRILYQKVDNCWQKKRLAP
ncbi:pyridoxamine 5'-phosphate oxidase [Vaginella massiliensis]|uniref:pyridoxamine 5'-phosphate oxidase n=1 Tax=Vaginella massiliensis TaxID=1816680 RepID=UPI000838C4E2|nr:pyridoxamine 5'-phosphate oxidase [Vaginella massiliensis]